MSARHRRPETRHSLPGALPDGEHVLWRGAPDWRVLARNALHLRGLALYLGLIVAWFAVSAVRRGQPASAVAFSTGCAVLAASLPIALGALYAWMAARAAAYTITNRRVVMRMGLVVPLTLNLPFAKIDGAALSPKRDGSGDVALKLAPGARGLNWFILWPHVRPGHFGATQPMLRALPDAAQAGRVLAAALAAASAESTDMSVAVASVVVADETRIVDTRECNHGATAVAA